MTTDTKTLTLPTLAELQDAAVALLHECLDSNCPRNGRQNTVLIVQSDPHNTSHLGVVLTVKALEDGAADWSYLDKRQQRLLENGYLSAMWLSVEFALYTKSHIRERELGQASLGGIECLSADAKSRLRSVDYLAQCVRELTAEALTVATQYTDDSASAMLAHLLLGNYTR